MYKEGSVHRVLEDYKITITGNKVKRQYDMNPFTHINKSWDDIDNHINTKDVVMVITEIPEHEFTKIVDTLCEFNDLMRDPETAKLLMEAKFINRLKGNR